MLYVSDYRTIGLTVCGIWGPLMQKKITVHTTGQCFTGTLTDTMPDWILLFPDKNRSVLISKKSIYAVEYNI